MRKITCLFLSWGCASFLLADTHYVVLNNPGAAADYTTWATAAANIQDAVDAAAANDVVLVSNGVYNTGGRAEGDYTLTNRVLITKVLELRAVSTNPADTVIEGAADPDGINGNGAAAVRAVRMAGYNAKIINFTIRNGHTQTNGNISLEQSGGGIHAHWGIVSNCVITNCGARADGGGFTYGHIYNSIVADNQADGVGSGTFGGGGAYNASLYNSVFVNNRSLKSGGAIAIANIISNCALAGNTATQFGGGFFTYSFGGFVVDSVLSNNTCGAYGGGAYNTRLLRCRFVGNKGGGIGGGAYGSRATNCVFYGNAANYGAGIGGNSSGIYPVYNCLFYSNTSTNGGAVYCAYPLNCTIVGNVASNGASGLMGNGSVATNCIIYDNTTKGTVSNYSGEVQLSHCNIWPLPTGSVDLGGNISNAPSFMDVSAGDYRLTANNLCINAGLTEGWMADSVDLSEDKRVRYGVVDMGCYEHLYRGTIYTIH